MFEVLFFMQMGVGTQKNTIFIALKIMNGLSKYDY